MSDLRCSIEVCGGSGLKIGNAVASVAGLSQGKGKIEWADVAKFDFVETELHRHPIKGAIGAAFGAAAGSLLGPVGAVAGLTAGASSFGLSRIRLVRLVCGQHGEVVFRSSAKNVDLIFSWWREHQR